MEYDVDLKVLFARRLSRADIKHALEKKGESIYVTIKGDDAVGAMADACIKVLCRDLQYFVLAKMADRLPMTINDKQQVLTESLRLARSRESLDGLIVDMKDYLRDTRDLCIEGYMQFRLQPSLLMWELCVEQAATEVLMQKEYAELREVLELCSRQRGSQVGELQLCIHSDGSCTLTDDTLVRIEYVDCSIEGIVSLLVNMAPKQLVVYDLTGGQGAGLTEAIQKVFCGRVKIYK